MLHPADTKSRNPRLQCDACGKWSRVHLKDGTQFSYGGCSVTHSDHNAAGSSQDVCHECCKAKCRKEAA